MTSTRNTSIDALKAFAILGVVWGHCIQNGSGMDFYTGTQYFSNKLFQVLYSFHMPLFMLISGYLFGGSAAKRSWGETVSYRAACLIIPIMVWSLIPISRIVFFHYQDTGTILPFLTILKEYLEKAFTNLWFLWALFWCTVIVATVRRFMKDSVWVYAGLFALSFLIPDGLNVKMYVFMYPFFVTGYLFRTRPSKGLVLEPRMRYLILGFCTAFYASLMLFFDSDTLIYTSGSCILRDGNISLPQLVTDFHRLLTGLSGSLMSILLFHILTPLCPGSVTRAASSLGRNTMGIYVISVTTLNIMLRQLTAGLAGFSLWASVLESLAILAISLTGIFLIKKSDFLTKILLGIRK